MKNAQTKLTEKENVLYRGIQEGMDRPGDGWFHEILSRIGWDDDHRAAGVLGSLVKKGLIWSEEVKEKGYPLCHWVSVIESNAGALDGNEATNEGEKTMSKTTTKTAAKKTAAKKTTKKVPAKRKVPAKKKTAPKTDLMDAPVDTTMDLGENDGIQIDVPYNPEPDADTRQDAPQAATTDAPAKVRRPGGLDAAYRLLVEEGRPMTAIEMTKITIERGMWTPAGKTPSNTMYAGIFNEIKKKGASARFIKVEKGFVHNPNI